MALAMSALQAIPALTGTHDIGFAWTLYTGDLVSHDAENLLSRCDKNRTQLETRLYSYLSTADHTWNTLR